MTMSQPYGVPPNEDPTLLPERLRGHPPTRQRPKFVGVWLSEAGLAAIDKRVGEEKTSRSGMLRRMLAYATLKMPKGWRP